MPHRINLGPPWAVTTSDGRTRHARRFGRPRTLDAGETVWLVCARVPGPAAVLLNGEQLATVEPGPFATEITSRLQPRNEVVFDTPSADPLGDVALEMRPGEETAGLHRPLATDIVVTPATPDDYAFTHDLTRANMEGYVARHWGAWNPDIYRQNYAATENHVIGLAGERVGFVRLRTEGDCLVLDDVQVRPECQNRGLGSAALTWAEELARARGLRALRLRCFHENPARRLYLRSGFVVAEPGPDADWLEKPTPGDRG